MNLFEYSELSFSQFLSMDSSLNKLTLSEQRKRYNNYLLEVSIIIQQQQNMVNSVTSGQGAAQVEVSGSGGIVPASSPVPAPSNSPVAPSVTPSITATPSVTVTPSISISVTPSVTVTPSISESPAVSVTPSVTVTPTISVTPSITATPSVTATPSITVTPSISVSSIPPSPTPTPSASPIVGRLNGIRILGSGNIIASANTAIMAGDIAALGYTSPNIVTTDLIGNTYTGADLDPALDDIVIVYTSNSTNVSVGAPELANNLKTYLTNGGRILWTNYFPSNPPGGTTGGFDYAITPFTSSVNNTNVGAGGGIIGVTRFEVASSHPILNGITQNANLAINLNSGINNLRAVWNIRPEATNIISLGANPFTIPSDANRTALVQTMTYSGSRVSMYNNSTLSQGFSNSTTMARRLVSNTILWTAGMI